MRRADFYEALPFILLAVGVAIMIAGFIRLENKEIPQPDQELRAKLFTSCLDHLPAGPKATMYNDWDEVVEACGRQAYQQSLRGAGL